MFGGHDNADAQASNGPVMDMPTPVADATSSPLPMATAPAAPATNDTMVINSAPAAADESTMPSMDSNPPTVAPAASDDLLQLKQQALQQLSPLLGHLDQSPEDRFRTTMMMIQAADDQSLIKEAYAAAQQITDEKVRAQALLDIVNEINYFTQQTQPAADSGEAAA